MLSKYSEKLNEEAGNKIRKYVINEFVEVLTKIIEKSNQVLEQQTIAE
jgi:hypothetical protein